MRKSEQVFYVSNKKLYEEYSKWYAAIEVAKEEEIEQPQIPPFICDSMLRIANRLSYKFNFVNYTFKEEMIGDALIDCVRFSTKFKLNYTNKAGEVVAGNPFSYITTICFNAFLRRIDKEKIQKYVKACIVSESADNEFLDNQNGDEGEYVNQYINFLREVGYAEESLPMSMRRTKKAKELKLLAGPLNAFEDTE